MGAHGWVAGICQPWGQFFYLGAGWPQWKPLDIPGTHLPLKRGSWLTSKKVLCCLLKTSLYFALPISRSMPFFVDKAMEEILSFFTCSSCFSICTFAFLLLLCRVDTSDFPQSKVTKLQRLSTQEDEQQPLSVHL